MAEGVVHLVEKSSCDHKFWGLNTAAAGILRKLWKKNNNKNKYNCQNVVEKQVEHWVSESKIQRLVVPGKNCRCSRGGSKVVRTID
jgi:hypothetical protein